MSGHVIYALTVGGGVLGLSPMPGYVGPYADGLAHFNDWRPSIVVSLTTAAEMVEHGAENLGADVQASGARWIHLPVRDYAIPEPEATERWKSAEQLAIAALAGGGRVLIHCRAGCGRSGMFCLRLMIRAGEEPDIALKHLRKIRPCAVETDEQFDWARAQLV